MTVRLEGTIKRFIGTSTDEKPRTPSYGPSRPASTDSDIPPGSSFLESDTGRIYRWSGVEWLAPEPDDLATILRSIDERLARLVEIAGDIAGS